MRWRVFPLLLSGVSALAIAMPQPVRARPRDDVRGLVEAGEIKPFEEIRSRVVSQTRGDYLGVQLDMESLIYRFRFIEDGRVFNVDVDARTGRMLNRRQSY